MALSPSQASQALLWFSQDQEKKEDWNTSNSQRYVQEEFLGTLIHTELNW